MDYLDTSILTSYYCPEPRSRKVQRLLSRLEKPAISPLVEVELHCSIARKVRAAQIKAIAARRVFAEFQEQLAEGCFRIASIRTAEYAIAIQWLAELSTPLRVLDALHLAVASTNDFQLLTADKGLARSAKHYGVKHKLVK